MSQQYCVKLSWANVSRIYVFKIRVYVYLTLPNNIFKMVAVLNVMFFRIKKKKEQNAVITHVIIALRRLRI